MSSHIMITLKYLHLQKPVKTETMVRVKVHLLPLFFLVIKRIRRVQCFPPKYLPPPSLAVGTGLHYYFFKRGVCVCAHVFYCSYPTTQGLLRYTSLHLTQLYFWEKCNVWKQGTGIKYKMFNFLQLSQNSFDSACIVICSFSEWI